MKNVDIYANDSSTGMVEWDLKKHGSMFIEFEFEIYGWDRSGTFNDITITIKKIERFNWDGDDVQMKPLNERNMKRIKNMIENDIHADYERYGIDLEDYAWDDDEPTIWNTIYSGYPSRVRDL